MHLAYRIVADDIDVTARFQDRLTSISIVDEAGQKSDRATITLDDRGYAIALPEPGAKLKIFLGFKGRLTFMGVFVVDEISGKISPDTLTIGAKATEMLSGIRSPKTRNWDNVTVLDVVAKIAVEYSLRPVVSDSLQWHFYTYLAQTSESDLNLLTRMASDLDAVAKPAGGHLIFTKRGEAKAADGSELPKFMFTKPQMSDGSWSISGRGKYGKVIAEWNELGAGKTRTVTVGDKDPVFRLRHKHPNEEEARRAARSKLESTKRGGAKVSIRLGGFHGDLLAEAKVDLWGIKPELSGEWLITRVQHQFGATLFTSFDAERDNEKP